MSRRPAALAVAMAAAVAAGVAGAPGAVAEDLGAGWQGSFGDPAIADGHEFLGEALVVPVRFEYDGPPGSVITDVTLELTPVESDCDPQTFSQPLDPGDGAGTATPFAPPPPGSTTEPARAEWVFEVDPRCNGVYDVAVVARADPPGVLQPGDPGTESGELRITAAAVSLAAPSPTGVVAEAQPDRKVAVRWQPPAAWANGAPADAYAYRVLREHADGSGQAVVADDLTLDTRSIVDDDLVGAPAGRYRYRVVAVRRAADGDLVASVPADAAVDLGAAPGQAPSTTRGTAGARGAAPGRSVRVGSTGLGQAVTAPPATIDTGFDPEIDYSGLDDAVTGPEQAIVPEDANLFEVVSEEPVGTGLLVPGAVALCLAVWAGHLRHLARRAAPAAR